MKAFHSKDVVVGVILSATLKQDLASRPSVDFSHSKSCLQLLGILAPEYMTYLTLLY